MQGLKYYLPRVHRYILTHMPLEDAQDARGYYSEVEPTAIVPLVDSMGNAAASTLDSLAKPAVFIQSYTCDFVPLYKLEELMMTFYREQPASPSSPPQQHWSFRLKVREEDDDDDGRNGYSTRAVLCAIVF